MTCFLIILATIIAIALVVFIVWFASSLAAGKCPLCMLKQPFMSKLTIDVNNLQNFENNTKKAPLMGWSSWNTFRNHIDDNLIYETAVALKETGLSDAGYKYVNLDDCWQSSLRDENGDLQGDLESFPYGIPNLVERINELDLKVGLYSSNGTLTCEDLPASLNNETKDAGTLARWGVEYFKYDFCHHEYISGDCPAIEYVDLNKENNFASIRLSPENATYTGKAKMIKIKELPSQKAFGLINHGAGSVSFDVDVDEEDEYTMTIHYYKVQNPHKQYCQVTINDKMYEVFFPASKPFTADARQQIKVKLYAGKNTITFQNPIVTKADSSFCQYLRMANALKNATADYASENKVDEKPITFSICEWGNADPSKWGAKVGNMWRTTSDILPNWLSIRYIYERNVRLYEYAYPGHYNDPDMLEVGNGKLSENENKAHFSLWCMMASPLVLGNDIRLLKDKSDEKAQSTLKILTNKELIAIDQDSLSKQAKPIKLTLFGIDVLARPLENGDVALCIFNKSPNKKNFNFSLNTLCDEPYLEFEKADEYKIHDLWDNETFNASNVNGTIDKHSVKVYRISK